MGVGEGWSADANGVLREYLRMQSRLGGWCPMWHGKRVQARGHIARYGDRPAKMRVPEDVTEPLAGDQWQRACCLSVDARA